MGTTSNVSMIMAACGSRRPAAPARRRWYEKMKLAEAKCLYHYKFGTAVEETQDSHLQRRQVSLCKLEPLFAQKYGHAVDDLVKSGCMWVKPVVDDLVCGITELQPLQVAPDTVE